MNSVFITGVPAAGKSYLAQKVSKKLDIPVLKVDDLRKEMAEDPELKKWVMFFWDTDEKQHYTETSCQQQWQNIVNQSEAFWEFTKKRIQEFLVTNTGIVEGVSLLPHLVAELSLKGIVLTGESEQALFNRIKQSPRWGQTEELQRMEAKAFYQCEGKHYQQEAEKYGFPTFSSADEAEKVLVELIK